jgi:hypothetical protein
VNFARPFPEPARVPFLAAKRRTDEEQRALIAVANADNRHPPGPPPGKRPLDPTTLIGLAIAAVVMLIIWYTLR